MTTHSLDCQPTALTWGFWQVMVVRRTPFCWASFSFFPLHLCLCHLYLTIYFWQPASQQDFVIIHALFGLPRGWVLSSCCPFLFKAVVLYLPATDGIYGSLPNYPHYLVLSLVGTILRVTAKSVSIWIWIICAVFWTVTNIITLSLLGDVYRAQTVQDDTQDE